MKKRFLSIALVLCMLLSIVPLTPVVATAETVTPTTVAKDITLGYSALHDADTENAKWDYVYFGTYNNNAIKWRVLSTNGNSTTVGTSTDTATYKTADGAEYTGKALFMLSENTLFNARFSATADGNVWQTSNLRSQMQDDIFGSTSNELKYVLKTTKEDTSETIDYINSYNDLYSTKWAESTLSDDTLFALSAREAEQYLGSGEKYANRKSGNATWWLRSPLAYFTDYAGVVFYDGVVYYFYVAYINGVRPALNLNLSSVLFTSAAFGGKSSDAAEGVVTANKNYGDIEGNDGYKLTLLDESRSGFSAYLKSLSGGKATVSYSGAKTGTSEYISVIIKNGNDVKYYGRVADVTDADYASGTVEITLPGDYNPESGDVLCVFNEQYNGDYKTDYASDLVVLPDYRWYTNDTTKSVFTISTVSEMVGFANLVNGTNLPDGVSGPVDFESKTVKLANDIDLKSIANWTPIGKNGADFEGTFDGNDRTISNLTVNSGEEDVGLFGYTYNATVKNLAVSGNVTGTGEYSKVGGIVGELSSGSITNCSFSGSVIGNGEYVGGIVGNAYGTISKCHNYAAVKGNALYAGGIVGDINGDIRYCYNQGSVTSESDDNPYLGGLIGRDITNGGKSIFSCYNTGSVTATGTNAGIGGTIGTVSGIPSLDLNDVYYLDSVATQGFGAINTTALQTDNTVAKSADAFASGEVAWLLQNSVADADGQVWGQTLTGSNKDDYPVFANENGSNKVYKVTFVIDEDTTDVKYVNGGTITVADPTAPNGYSFGGWYTAQTGGTEVTTITADTTLYARFTPNTYTVTYNAGANGTGTVAAGSKTHGVNFTLSSNTFTRTGYTQTGWATSDGGEKVYDLGGTYTADTAVTLYPVWTINEYTITVKPENGDIDITIKQDYGTTVTAPTLTRDGYAFDGWDKTFPTTMPAENMTITAKWIDNENPVISGIKNGKTYCSAQTVTVTDNGTIRSVTVNGNDVQLDNDGKFTLNPATGEQTIIATDTDGNTATMKVTINDGHTGGTATCKDKAVCDYCGEPYGELNGSTHAGGTHIKNDKAATCNEDGYTGDTYCKGCETKLQDGKPITKLGHTDTDKNHVCDRENCKATISTCSGGTATCKDQAICDYCGEKYGEVDPDNHVGELTWTIDGKTHEQKCEACGEIVVKNEKHSFLWGSCCDCGYVSNFRIVFCLCRAVWYIVQLFDSGIGYIAGWIASLF